MDELKDALKSDFGAVADGSNAKRSLFLVAVLACGSTDASAPTAHRKSPGFGTAGLGQVEPGDHHRKNHKQRVGQGCGNGQEFGSVGAGECLFRVRGRGVFGEGWFHGGPAASDAEAGQWCRGAEGEG